MNIPSILLKIRDYYREVWGFDLVTDANQISLLRIIAVLPDLGLAGGQTRAAGAAARGRDRGEEVDYWQSFPHQLIFYFSIGLETIFDILYCSLGIQIRVTMRSSNQSNDEES